MAFSPDGLLLASASLRAARIWDARTGRLHHTILAREKARSITAVAFSPDGRCLATAELRSACEDLGRDDRRTAPHLERTYWAGHWPGIQSVMAAAWPPAAKTRRSSSGTWTPVKRYLTSAGTLPGASAWRSARDGRRFASAGLDADIRIWDATPLKGDEGLESLTLPHDDEVWSVAFSPDGRRIASGSWD